VAAGALVLLAALAAGQAQAGSTAIAHPPAPLPVDAPAITSYANGINVGHSAKNDVSRPLREISVQPAARWSKPQYLPHPGMETSTDGVNMDAPDPVVQRSGGSQAPNAMPTPLVSFEGITNQHGGLPPDTNGEVGPNHYVQMVNTDFAVYTKTGTRLYGPALISTLWDNFGAPCENNNDGDPVVLYDQLADRWLLSQFTTVTPFGECVAVSTSADPTGSYYRYFFQFSTTVFYDYPHLGVWPDGYYMGTNRFNGIAGAFIGPAVHVLDRAAMIAGQPASFQEVDLTRGGTLLPADLDGALLPPAGSPDYFLAKFGNRNLDFYKCHADWATPANSLFTGPTGITTAAYTSLSGNSIAQPGTAQTLDSLGDRLMFRLAYRNFGSYESLVVNHSADVGQGSTVQAGIRWYEIRSPNTTPTIFQQGTFAPADGVSRWMGSTAQDASGNLAVGYSVSDSTLTFPGIRYAGRLAGDPPGTLNQGEATLIAGSGSQTDPSGRWGDYSDLTVDPTDDCTFWYTTEYYGSTSQAAWQTRIGSFRFPGCQSPTATPTATGTLPTATVTHTPTLSPTPTSTPCAVTSGSITAGDPTQIGRTARDGIASSCRFPKTYAGPVAGDTTPRHYDSYTYTNSSGGPVCVTVVLDATGCAGNQIFAAAYLNSFNPANLATNWLADMGNSPNPVASFSFTVPAGATYVVVVNEITANQGCAGYTLSVIGACGGVAPPTATTTANPTNTSTRTATVTNTVVPPTGTITSTAVPPTSTSTRTATVTNTVVPPTGTSTVTSTVVPPTGTSTSTTVPATGTSTRTATVTNTAVPPTSTSTATVTQTGVPNTATTTSTGVPNTATSTATRTSTGVPNTATSTTVPSTATGTRTATVTRTPCPVTFSDVLPSDYFYEPVLYLACHGVIGGYSDGTYRPYNNTTRGQMAKIVVGAFGLAITTPAAGGFTFTDVPPSSTFFGYVETAANAGSVSGYPCGGVNPQTGAAETCDGASRPYYRVGNNVTRGQLAKIVVIAAQGAAGWSLISPATATFSDVPVGSTFYPYIETAACHQVLGGYSDGTFRPSANATRGQIAKIVYYAIGSGACWGPAATPPALR
jgi:hypothetical protein